MTLCYFPHFFDANVSFGSNNSLGRTKRIAGPFINQASALESTEAVKFRNINPTNRGLIDEPQKSTSYFP